MSVRETILQKINEKKYGTEEVADETNLYRDLHFDSLSFICLITEIEELYGIEFGVMEMETCLQTGRFIALTEQKVRERAAHD